MIKEKSVGEPGEISLPTSRRRLKVCRNFAKKRIEKPPAPCTRAIAPSSGLTVFITFQFFASHSLSRSPFLLNRVSPALSLRALYFASPVVPFFVLSSFSLFFNCFVIYRSRAARAYIYGRATLLYGFGGPRGIRKFVKFCILLEIGILTCLMAGIFFVPGSEREREGTRERIYVKKFNELR